jgi:hypothetical protein
MRLTAATFRLGRLGALTALAMLAALTYVSAAAAVKLNGDWAPFTRCPVDNAKMLAATGDTTVASCVVSDSPSGSITIGNSTTPTGDANLQFGLFQNNGTSVSTFTVVAPSGGALVAAPAQVPGGLLGIMCPSNIPIVSSLCQQAENNNLNAVTAVVQPAGAPSNLNIPAQFQVGKPIIQLPVKVRLQNPLLGSSCYIGSGSSPIVLHPENLTAPTFGPGELFDANGTPDPTNGVLQSLILNGTQGDNSFSVPGASGCGGLLSLVVDQAIDLKLGLPSPSGKNRLVLNNSTSDTVTFTDPPAFAPYEGKALSQAWHSAVVP